MGWLAERRVRRILERNPLPDELWRRTIRSRRSFDGFAAEELGELRETATVFAHEKHFASPGSGPVDDGTRVEIAVLAALPVFRIGLSWYRNWRSIVVVPRAFVRKHVSDEDGVVHEWEGADAGESWENGPVVLSLRDVAASRRGDGYNVVIHEAAHRIDMTDGEINGRPALHRGMDGRHWFEVCRAAYEDLCRRLEEGSPTRIDPYAAESDAEFYAVMTEFFFERPGVVRAEYPELYDLFTVFYRQDPAARMQRTARRNRR